MAKPPKAQLPLNKFLEQYGKERYEMARTGELMRTQTTVALHRRFRGATLSDRIGRFIWGGTNLWRGDGSDDLEGVNLKCINIVKPSVKMNMAALSSARVAINNEAANKDPELKGAANVADGIFQYLDDNEDHWSGTLESRYCQMIQTGYGVFIQSRHNPKKKAEYVETQEWNEEPSSMPGEYACKCGAGGPFDHEVNEDEDLETIKCPKCGQPAEVTKAPELATIPRPGEKERFNPGDNETKIRSCLEVRVDERNSQGGNLLQANWLDHHYLVTDGELEQEFPDYDFGPSTEWCYALKWKYALETGEDVFIAPSTADEYRKRRERRDIYVLPEEYCNRVEPEDYEIRDGQDNVVFSIQAGEKLVDIFPEGFCYSLINEKLAPYFREVDFRDEWSYGCYMPDAHSFWGQPLVELLQIQDDWNTLYTIDIQHRERNSITQIVYNSQMFDADSWERDLVPTGEGFTQGDQPLTHYFHQVQSVPMTEAVAGLKFLFEILPYVGGAPPEAIGVDPPGTDNYHAQLLRKQSTLGQLQPPGESKANCKVRWFRNQLKLWQANAPEERFYYLRTRFGEEWKDDDIDAFLNCNIERDIISHYVEGTEIPTSYIERRIDLETVIRTFIDQQLSPPKDLLAQYFDLLGIDYDLEGMEADNRLNDARYTTIKQGVEALKGRVPETPTVGPDGQPGPSMLCQRVLSHPQLQVLSKENHGEAIKFYVSREIAIMAQEMPDTVLIECLEGMIAKHEAAGVQAQQSAAKQQIAGQAPLLEAQAAMQPQEPDGTQEAQIKAQAETQKEQSKAQQKAEDRDFKALDKHTQRQFEIEKIDKEQTHQASIEAMKLGSQERMAAMQAAIQAKTAKEQAKQKPQSKAA